MRESNENYRSLFDCLSLFGKNDQQIEEMCYPWTRGPLSLMEIDSSHGKIFPKQFQSSRIQFSVGRQGSESGEIRYDYTRIQLWHTQ